MKGNRNAPMCGYCDAGLPMECICKPVWLVRKNNLEDNRWWLYYAPRGKPAEAVAWAFNFKAAQRYFPIAAKKFLEGYES